MNTERIHRYPGVRPFETRERHLFFGRKHDIEELTDLILLEKLVVLFAKSGYGKSSLLKAGIVPAFTDPEAPEARRYHPVQVRFGTYVEGKSVPPLDAVLHALDTFVVGRDFHFLAQLGTQSRLWHHFKMRQSVGDTARFLLIFDQFEEFFSYPEAQQAAFRAELAELLYEDIPQDVRSAAREASREQRAFLATPFDAKAVFSIRADRLSLLDGMKDKLPAILHKRYELRALDERQAREAIVAPAALRPGSAGDFASSAFSYAPDALDIMLRELSGAEQGENARIEAFQLQIVCASLEKRVTERALNIVTAADLPDFDTVYEDYYKDRIGELPEVGRLPARRVLEDGLLLVDAQTGDARRLSRDADELAQALGVPQELLLDLERTYLIRREVNSLGGYNFEISHDTLIAPVLKARREREAEQEERRKELERLEAEQRAREAEEKALAEKRRAEEAERLRQVAEQEKRKAQKRTLFAVAFAALALLALLMAASLYNRAEKQKAEAEGLKTKAEKALSLYKKEQAAKDRIEIENLKKRAEDLKKNGFFQSAGEMYEQAGSLAARYNTFPDMRAEIQLLDSLLLDCERRPVKGD